MALPPDGPVVMGILNLTPDSFSDGGVHTGLEAALAHARKMLADGATIIDIGGESTRPGAQPVSEDDELARVIPVIEALRAESDCAISIDTMKPGVMRAAAAAGATMINDVNALRSPGALEAAVESGAEVCLMHMRGEPRTMQADPVYDDVVSEVREFLTERARAFIKAGGDASRLVVDPGIGFGKTLEHNLALLAGIPALASLGHRVLIGVSRKSMFGKLLGRELGERMPASVAAALLAAQAGAHILRVHDVRETIDALRVARAVAQHRIEQ